MHTVCFIVYEGLELLKILVSERSSWKQFLSGSEGDCTSYKALAATLL